MAIGVNSNYKFVKVNTDSNKVYYFNDHNRWVELCDLDDLTLSLIGSKGITYNALKTSYNMIYLDYSEVETLSDGSIVYESEEINPTMGVTALSEETLNDAEVLGCTVSSFTPMDKVASNELLFAGSTVKVEPSIESEEITPNSIHKGEVNVKVKAICNYNEQLKLRYKINDGEFSEWSSPFNCINPYDFTISTKQLKLGVNGLTIELISTLNESNTNSNVITNAINIVNDLPTIMIIDSESDSHRVSFAISDPDSEDKVQYKIMINDVVVKDWSELQLQPVNVNYIIQNNDVEIDKENTLKIIYRDEYKEKDLEAVYTFTGSYNNILFKDEDGEYLSDDNGNNLKLLDFGDMIAGTETDVKKITLINNTSVDLTNVKVNVEYTNPVENARVLFSKGKLPFNNLTSIDYGNDVLHVGETKEFYLKIDTLLDSKGRCLFNIIGSADRA